MVYSVDNSINFGDERKSNDTNPLQRNRGAENGAGNDIANMVPEPRGRGAKALRFRRVRPIPRRAVEAFPQSMRHRNMRSKVVPRSHGLSSLQTVKARVLNLLRAKREQSRRERRRMKDRHLTETEFPMSAGHSDGSRRSLRRDCRAHVHEQAE